MAEIRKRLPNMANRIKTYDWVAKDDTEANKVKEVDFRLEDSKDDLEWLFVRACDNFADA